MSEVLIVAVFSRESECLWVVVFLLARVFVAFRVCLCVYAYVITSEALVLRKAR